MERRNRKNTERKGKRGKEKRKTSERTFTLSFSLRHMNKFNRVPATPTPYAGLTLFESQAMKQSGAKPPATAQTPQQQTPLVRKSISSKRGRGRKKERREWLVRWIRDKERERRETEEKAVDTIGKEYRAHLLSLLQTALLRRALPLPAAQPQTRHRLRSALCRRCRLPLCISRVLLTRISSSQSGNGE